jgi:transmembrane sensor
MPSPPENHADGVLPEAIQLAAAEWLVRQDHGLSTSERTEFARWLGADARHEAAYRELRETWSLLDHVPASRVPLPPRRPRHRLWTGLAVAAAAAVAIAIVPPALNRASREGADQRTATAIGEFGRLDLSDGSVVRLNTATAVTVAFSASERRVMLQSGEASFDVAKDTARPFVVRAGTVEVRAVGTAFNVRQRGDAIDVLVTEGSVRVDDAVSGTSLLPARVEGSVTVASAATAAATALSAGQRATISPSRGEHPKAPVEIVDVAPPVMARVLAWHDRQLEFSEEPLANIAAEFNRYNEHRLVVDDPTLATQRFGGKFSANDFATLVHLLEANFGVIVERRENETVLRRALRAR